MHKHYLLDSRLRFIQQKQEYQKEKEMRRKYEQLRERAEQRRRRQQVDRLILQSRLKERCNKAIDQIGKQRTLKRWLVTEIKQRCLKNRLNCELKFIVHRMVVQALRKQDQKRWSRMEERQVLLKAREVDDEVDV